jgi:hypothetical protein
MGRYETLWDHYNGVPQGHYRTTIMVCHQGRYATTI